MSVGVTESAKRGTVLSCCISVKKGTRKVPVDSIEVCVGEGIKGDAHAGNWHRQVSLLGLGEIDEGRTVTSRRFCRKYTDLRSCTA